MCEKIVEDVRDSLGVPQYSNQDLSPKSPASAASGAPTLLSWVSVVVPRMRLQTRPA